MLHETVRYLREHHPACRQVGLLATSGTLASRVYHDAIEAAGLHALAPNETNQARVINAIYGEKGVKAGYTEGECRDDLLLALTDLVERGRKPSSWAARNSAAARAVAGLSDCRQTRRPARSDGHLGAALRALVHKHASAADVA